MNILAASEVIRSNNADHRHNGSGKTTTNTTTTTTMMDEPQTPGSDCNSNPANENQDHVSSAFIQDNTDFWFIDYRDGGLHVHPSVLSSLSASYTKDDLGYYDDLARNLDANLAEVDMENCKTSDLHTLLNALPTMCTDPVQHSEFNYQREEFATLTGSVMEEIGFKLHDANSQGEDSACSTTSICKSSLLFSPVKEIPVLPSGASYSVDSLDCEDMLITCKTNNKDNYTIAFEGSMAMYSDSSDNQDFDNHGDGQKRMIGAYEAPDSYYGQALNLKNMLDLSMACSDTKIYTTWSNLYKHISGAGGGGGGGIGGGAKTMKRHPSGNNNTEPNFLLQQSSGGGCINASDASTRAVIAAARAANDAFNGKSRSRSLPDLKRSASKNRCDVALNFSVDSGETSSRSSNNRLQSSASMMSRSMANDHEDNDDKSSDSVCGTNTMSSGSNSSSSTGTGSKKLHNMSLVRLYMKQKSTSAEGMSLTLDSESGCWPTTSNSGESANNATLVSKQQQQQQQNNSGSNDLAIKWVKTDSLATATTTTTENTSQAYKKMSTIACSTSMDDLTSRSILSLAKDDANNSCSDKSKLLSDDASNCTTLKISTGIQTAGKTVETEDNGVQTSLIYPPHHGEQTSPDSGKASSSSSGGNNTISTSSLKQQTTTREHIVNTEKPVYVVYPNYALPDLSFLSAVSADRISLKPQAFRPTSRGGVVGGRRPFSCGDFDALKHRNFNHVKDWDSLNFLLPKEYRQAALQCVPEAAAAACNGKSRLIHDEKQPLYWLQPRSKKRAMFFNDAAHQQNVTNLSSSSSTGTQPSSGYRGSSTILSDSSANQQNSANSATGNNPLYLYRYDSVSSEASLLGQEKQQINRQQQQQNRGAPTLPKRSVSLPQNECPPRPPLPRGILRKHHRAAAAAAATANNNNAAAVAGKRSSMFEQGNCAMETNVESNKRMSLQELYFMNNDLHFLKNAGVVESEKDIDEAEEKQQFDRLRGFDNEEPLSLDDEFKQLDDFLNRSNYSTCSDDSSCDLDKSMKLRSCVKKFLALKINQDIPKMIDMTDSQKKTVSFAVSRKQGLMQDIAKDRLNVSEATDQKMDNRPINLEEKKKLIKSVGKAVDVLLKYWNSEPVRSRQDYNDKNECSQLCLNYLCPAIYAVMSDELKPHLDSTFGPISNSVWQVVEASSQQGPLTKTLNDLVQKINAEDFIPEGMLKFRAFVFGLLNLRSLDAWFAYLCSRESVVRKHYKSSNLFVSALSCPASREVVDSLLNVLQPLIYCPFQLDLLYQYRQLHNSFGVPSSEQVIKRSVRPRSCVMYDEDNKKDEGDAKKRWSHNPMSAMFHVQDRLDDSDDYTDSLEHTPMKKASPNNNKIMTSKTARQTCGGDLKLRKDEAAAMKSAEAKGENHFRKLQEKWECLGREDSSPKEAYPLQSPSSLASPTTPTRTMSFNKSKIPRPLLSPVKSPSGLPVPVKNPRASAIPAPKKSAAPTTTTTTTTLQKKSPTQQESPRRTSRVDQTGASSVRSPMTRPSSLPYKTYQGQQDRNGVVHRRAASTSLPRPHSIAAPPSRHISSKQPAPKLVRATSSRPPSQSGHLAFTEGETIKVILEVDAKWLLCERGTRKGLVPRNCVKPLPT